jgi:hypothetical protein
VEKICAQIYQALQTLLGLHRQLLETVRLEREALTQADLKAIEKVTAAKQLLVEEIHSAEIARLKLTAELALVWKKPFKDLTLSSIIIGLQSAYPKRSEQLQSSFNALNVLIQRIIEQNEANRKLVEQSLAHIHIMKKNVFTEAAQKSSTYTQQAQCMNTPVSSRLFSREA